MTFRDFLQSAPSLDSQYDDDRVLRSYLSHALPEEVLEEIAPTLREMGRLSAEELYGLQRADRGKEPVLTQWSAWGERIDHIEPTPLWREAERVAATHGVVATAYERAHGRYSRIHQFALAYLFAPSTEIYACPLAMTDGAARTLLESGNRALIDRAVPHLTTRDPREFWTSGQWMTETTGGSDVGLSETVARQEDGGWRLYGKKWFTSAAASQMALTLGRPEGNGPGGRGLALFYVETRDADERLRNIEILRLKEKLGTRKLPTAELLLQGTPAQLVTGTTDGVRSITPMLNVTRTWNAVSALAFMRRGIALARDYARRRVAFGAPLSEKPLHLDTLAGLQAEFEGAFHLTFRVVELLGKLETGELSEDEVVLLRVLTPVAKLTTARQAVTVSSEVLESFGGAGYLEDTGIPTLLRDSQVLSIWEGTTNVLSLDVLRALGEGEGVAVLRREMERALAGVRDPALEAAVSTAREAVTRAERWLHSSARDREQREAAARRLALTLGRSLELALLAAHAQRSLDRDGDARSAAAARRLARNRVDLLGSESLAESRALANDFPLGHEDL